MSIKNQIFKNGESDKKEGKVLKLSRKGLEILFYLLVLILFVIIIRQFYDLVTMTLFGDIKNTVDAVLFIFILIELQIILFEYILKGFIKVESIIEVGIISLVRETIFHILDMTPLRIFSLAAVLLVFGGIFYIERNGTKMKK